MIKFLPTAITAAAIAVSISTPAVSQDNWPDRNVSLVVPYAAGGLGDSVARIAARFVSKELGQTIVIENRPGGGGIIGTEIVSRAKPDGYTFCACGGGAITTAPFVDPNVKYKPMENFDFVGMLNTNPLIVMVRSDLPIKNMKELVAYAKANPGKLNYSSSGVGGGMHFSTALFQSTTGIDMVHIPYNGGATATMALLTSSVDVVFTNSTDAMPYLRGNDKVRVLGVSSPKRMPFAPNIPAIAEEIPNYEVQIWSGVLAPRGTPAPIIQKLSAALFKMASDPTVIESYHRVGAATMALTSDQFRDFVKRDIDLWVQLMKDTNYKPKTQ